MSKSKNERKREIQQRLEKLGNDHNTTSKVTKIADRLSHISDAPVVPSNLVDRESMVCRDVSKRMRKQKIIERLNRVADGSQSARGVAPNPTSEGFSPQSARSVASTGTAPSDIAKLVERRAERQRKKQEIKAILARLQDNEEAVDNKPAEKVELTSAMVRRQHIINKLTKEIDADTTRLALHQLKDPEEEVRARVQRRKELRDRMQKEYDEEYSELVRQKAQSQSEEKEICDLSAGMKEFVNAMDEEAVPKWKRKEMLLQRLKKDYEASGAEINILQRQRTAQAHSELPVLTSKQQRKKEIIEKLQRETEQLQRQLQKEAEDAEERRRTREDAMRREIEEIATESGSKEIAQMAKTMDPALPKWKRKQLVYEQLKQELTTDDFQVSSGHKLAKAHKKRDILNKIQNEISEREQQVETQATQIQYDHQVMVAKLATELEQFMNGIAATSGNNLESQKLIIDRLKDTLNDEALVFIVLDVKENQGDLSDDDADIVFQTDLGVKHANSALSHPAEVLFDEFAEAGRQWYRRPIEPDFGAIPMEDDHGQGLHGQRHNVPQAKGAEELIEAIPNAHRSPVRASGTAEEEEEERRTKRAPLHKDAPVVDMLSKRERKKQVVGHVNNMKAEMIETLQRELKIQEEKLHDQEKRAAAAETKKVGKTPTPPTYENGLSLVTRELFKQQALSMESLLRKKEEKLKSRLKKYESHPLYQEWLRWCDSMKLTAVDPEDPILGVPQYEYNKKIEEENERAQSERLEEQRKWKERQLLKNQEILYSEQLPGMWEDTENTLNKLAKEVDKLEEEEEMDRINFNVYDEYLGEDDEYLRIEEELKELESHSMVDGSHLGDWAAELGTWESDLNVNRSPNASNDKASPKREAGRRHQNPRNWDDADWFSSPAPAPVTDSAAPLETTSAPPSGRRRRGEEREDAAHTVPLAKGGPKAEEKSSATGVPIWLQ